MWVKMKILKEKHHIHLKRYLGNLILLHHKMLELLSNQDLVSINKTHQIYKNKNKNKILMQIVNTNLSS